MFTNPFWLKLVLDLQALAGGSPLTPGTRAAAMVGRMSPPLPGGRSRASPILAAWLLAGAVAAASLAMHFLSPASSPTSSRADRVNTQARGASLRSASAPAMVDPEAADLPQHIAAGALAGSLAALLLAAVSLAARLGAPEVHMAYLTGDSGAVAGAQAAELQHALGAAQATALQAINHAAMELRSGLEGATQTQKLAAGLGVALAAGLAAATEAPGQPASTSPTPRSALSAAPEGLASAASSASAAARLAFQADLVAAATIGVQSPKLEAIPAAPVLNDREELRQFLLSDERQRQALAFRSMEATAPEDLVAAATIGIKPKATAAAPVLSNAKELRQFLLSDERQRQALAFSSMEAVAPEDLVAAATIGVQPPKLEAIPAAQVLSDSEELRQLLLS